MTPPTAVQLKEEGNAFFIKKDYLHANDKYTEAIAIDGQNAILYANRSACNLGMGKFLDASRDAFRATELDPAYAKGWSRRASAHEATLEWPGAVDAWQKALDALPKADLSPAELKQKEQYTTSLQKAKQRLDAAPAWPFSGILTNHRTEKPPWVLAEEMLPELEAAGPAKYASSAWMIHSANREFMEGVGHMKGLRKIEIKGAPEGYGIVGHTDGLACLSNGILSDLRVFRIDCGNWFKLFNEQFAFESEKRRAWTYEQVDVIQQSALERLKKKGWGDVRPALSVVIRGWIMVAVVDFQVRQAPHVAVERLKQTLELLHWGRQVWRDVSKEDRGAIFQNTFVRGVKVIYLEALMNAYAKATGVDKKAFLDTLHEAANELLQDTLKASDQPESIGPVEPGFVSSFCVYPAAQAYAMLGYYHAQTAQYCDNPVEKRTYYFLAAKAYTQAARALPEDDEKHCWYLNCTIDPMLRAGMPRDTIKGVAKTIREVMPKMQRIWAHSALAKQGRDAMIGMGLREAESA